MDNPASKASETTGVALTANDEGIVSDSEFSKYTEEWKELAKQRPLRILVCGLGGAGKTTLINRLLQLKHSDEKEGETAANPVVTKHERTTERGIKVCLFDTLGFDDIDMSNEQIIAAMENQTEKVVDIIFYCISLDGSVRVQYADVQAIKMMTQAFSSEIWNKAIIVLTFANVLENKVQYPSEYEATITHIKDKVRLVLRDALVDEDIVAQIPMVTAGYTNPVLKYESQECMCLGGWDNRLFLEALKQVDPAAFPALFEVHWSWKDLKSTLGGGAAMITGVSTGVGAMIGAAVGSPLGVGLGAVVGAGIGAGVGVAGGAGIGTFAFQLLKIKSILKIKYQKWRMNYSTSLDQSPS